MSEKGCYIRIGSSAQPMTVKMIEHIFARRTRNTISNIRSPKSKLTFSQLKIYYEEGGKKLNNKFAENLELLTGDGNYNYVGYMFADVNNISVKVAKYNEKI